MTPRLLGKIANCSQLHYDVCNVSWSLTRVVARRTSTVYRTWAISLNLTCDSAINLGKEDVEIYIYIFKAGVRIIRLVMFNAG